MIEPHPLQPFLPPNARLLMLGSFPPQRKRWSMEFYYPNWNNDMWRIVGQIFFGNPHHFELPGQKAFNRQQLVDFLQQTGIALYDTACVVRRLHDNASDKFLEVVTPTDIPALLDQIPLCRAIVTTGEKATLTLCSPTGTTPPTLGNSIPLTIGSRHVRLYRMPSSSRAYPLALDKKAAVYRTMFQAIFPVPHIKTGKEPNDNTTPSSE